MADAFVVGYICAIDKDSGRGSVGDYAVVASVDSPAPNNKACIKVLPCTISEAQELSSYFRAKDAAAAGGHPPVAESAAVRTLLAAVKCTLTDVTRASLSNGSFSSNWRQLVTTLPSGGDRTEPHRPPPAAAGADLVGKEEYRVVNLPVVVDGCVAHVFTGVIQIVAAEGTNVTVEFEHASLGSISALYNHSLVRGAYEAPAPAAQPFSISGSLLGGVAFKAVCALQLSKSVVAGSLDPMWSASRDLQSSRPSCCKRCAARRR